ncbi:DNA ligase [Sulfurospirillum arcachonense]|uniref:DNA ligase n=1 Tax=Sulfurospirillum arcachonense TaxID=57666 RepID=UPI0004690042|nr:DNA ligase [Sulfurospirillum arcachonense]
MIICKYLLILFLPFFLFAQKPDLLLLKTYNESLHVDGWFMSEKLDGVRAYWDGKKLISRGGKVFKAPKWFTKDFPLFEIDGELWSKRDDFDNISGIVRKQTPHKGWKNLTYNIFEVPNQKGGLKNRLDVLDDFLKVKPNKYIKIIKQITCKDKQHLKSFLKKIEDKGGEGVVIRNQNALYINKRTAEALKVKSFFDSECEVIGYKKGRGKYENLLGSLICKMKNGVIINLGSGLSDILRRNPPKKGIIVTFKYQGLTKNGKPRFPVFMRVKDEIK